MKLIRIGVLGIAAFLGLFLSGCAGGPDERSAGEFIDDTAIHTKVKAALINDPIIAGRSIDVSVNKGVVRLSGAVNSEVEKKKAEDTAAGVKGVRSVQSNLVVRQANPPVTNPPVTNAPPK